MSSLKERLLLFIAYLGVEKSKFEQVTGLSNGFVDKSGDNIRSSSLEKISNTYPLLNTEWLRCGTGEMLKNSITQNNQNGDNIQGTSISIQKSETEVFLELLKKKDEQIDRLLSIIEKLS